MVSFPVNDYTEEPWKSNKIIKIIMGPGTGRQRKVAVNQIGLPLTSSLLLEYSSEYLNEYSSTR